MHNKELFKANGKCIESIKNNVGCAFCRGMKRCEDYPENVPAAMNEMNKRWIAEWNTTNNIEEQKPVKRMKHKPTPKQAENAQSTN